MKLIYILLLFSFISILSSCSDNPVVEADYTDLTEWTYIDSTTSGLIEQLAIAEENILYIVRNNSGYKIENGVTTQINFSDNDFYPTRVFAYNSSYVIFQGRSRSTLYQKIKIIKDNIIISPAGMPQDYQSTEVLIIEKDKFVFGMDSVCYLYRNGVFSQIVLRSPYGNQISVDKFFIADTALCALTYTNNNIGNYIYNIRDNYGYFLENEPPGQRFFLGNNLAKISEGAGTTNLNLYTLSGLRTIFSGPSRDYYKIIGENRSYLYMIASEHTGYLNVKNIIWNGEKFIEQSYQPFFSNTYYYITYFSNMKNNVFYCAWSTGSKYYLYKAKRVLRN